ncbi:MAG: class I SAM-dependent methyltransferase [Alphaproteobacteria bacterium]
MKGAPAAAAGCPLCGSHEAEPFAEKDGYEFARCRRCRFIYLDPMPSDRQLAAHYNEEGSHDAYLAKRSSRIRRAHGKLLRFFPYALAKDVLDLGCGGGFAVSALGRIARRAIGLDISENAIAFARTAFPRRTFICADFRESGLASDSFDFVHASEIIEHVNDLAGFMAFVTRVTRPGGCVYVTTPDIGHPAVPADVRQWDVFTPPGHLQFFDRDTLTDVFARSGFVARRHYRHRKPGLQMLFRKPPGGRL